MWDPALSTIDGDLLGGNIDPIANPNGIGPAAGILLATLTFQAPILSVAVCVLL